MDVNFTPILVVPAIPYNGGIRFLHYESQIDIDSKMADIVWKILSYCNGYMKASTIAESVCLDEDKVLEILKELEELELIVDSKHQFMHFHRVSNYPSAINANLTQDEIAVYTKSNRLPVKDGEAIYFEYDKASVMFELIKKRRSCRNFSDKSITISQIGNICHYAYSIPDHSVPSGGALYPLKIYVLIEKDQDGIKAGYYEYDAEQNCLILFNDDVDIEQLKFCFNQDKMPFGSSVQIIIAADLERQPYKYANRGYRLTLIEAGHVAENISLYCAEQGLGACEMGGVQDQSLRQELNLSDSIWPLIAIPLGHPASSKMDEFDKIRFVENHVGEELPVNKVFSNIFNGNDSFFGATAIYRDAKNEVQYAGATSSSYADAIFKATMEGYERFQSSQMKVDFYGTAKQIHEKWLDPRDYFPLTKNQAKRCHVKYFTEDIDINWTLGIDCDGSDIYIPSDLIYYGQIDSGNRIYYGHSSGIAAHFSFEEAKIRATIELIERDALMRSWFSQEPPLRINEWTLPIHARKRIAYYAKQNRQLIVLQIPSDFGMVFETVIVGDEYPYFISGAAATINVDSINNAILKSIQEAEYSFSLTLSYPDKTPIGPTDVLTPIDHGRVYHFKKNADKLHWLWKDAVPISHVQENVSIKDVNWFCNKYLQLKVVDLSNKDSDIKVVRVFSPLLVPINFGFNSLHYTHRIIQYNVSVSPDSLKMPHYFA